MTTRLSQSLPWILLPVLATLTVSPFALAEESSAFVIAERPGKTLTLTDRVDYSSFSYTTAALWRINDDIPAD